MTVPREDIAWVPKRAPVREAVERTLRVAVTTTRSLILNLAVEIVEEEDWVTEELEEEGVAEDELEEMATDEEELDEGIIDDEDWLMDDWEEEEREED